MRATVKDMPPYDPDAELVGLTLTIPSWVSSLDRLQQNISLNKVTPRAKLQLIKALVTLDDKAIKLTQYLGGGPHE